MAEKAAPPSNPFSSLLDGVDTSDPSAVAQAVANYMDQHRDSLTEDEANQVYQLMWDNGVPFVATPPPVPGFPSTTG